jgi:hypothetical protein
MLRNIITNVPKHVIDAMMSAPGGFAGFGMDAATATGLAFLQAELEKRDPKVREPLTSVTFARDIVIKSGGGWVDFTSTMNVQYATAGPNMYGLIGGQTNTIPTMQADIGKDVFPVFNWANIMRVPYVDMQKLQGLGRSLDDLLDKGIKLNWNKAQDLMCYQGFGASGGIVNNSNITAYAVDDGAAGTKTWITKTPAEILNDVNKIMLLTWAASEYDVSGMANHILIPPAQYAYISNQLISVAGSVSILTYLLENNIGKTQGVDLQIFPSRWCTGAGVGPTDRMVAYVNDDDRLYMDVPVPVSRAMTQPSVGDAAYLTLFMGQIGVPKFLYYQPARYGDGI